MSTIRNAATSITLLTGVIVSGVLLLSGLILQLVRGGPTPQLQSLELHAVLPRLATLDPVMVIHLGVLALMFTPFARVIVQMATFARRREWAFALISAGVLFLLAIGVAAGLGGE
ncbi:MAG: DUF1634 domain-containing protein [Thermoanaerobaculia bacterium]